MPVYKSDLTINELQQYPLTTDPTRVTIDSSSTTLFSPSRHKTGRRLAPGARGRVFDSRFMRSLNVNTPIWYWTSVDESANVHFVRWTTLASKTGANTPKKAMGSATWKTCVRSFVIRIQGCAMGWGGWGWGVWVWREKIGIQRQSKNEEKSQGRNYKTVRVFDCIVSFGFIQAGVGPVSSLESSNLKRHASPWLCPIEKKHR